jgi:hypothetical protein
VSCKNGNAWMARWRRRRRRATATAAWTCGRGAVGCIGQWEKSDDLSISGRNGVWRCWAFRWLVGISPTASRHAFGWYQPCSERPLHVHSDFCA